MKVFVLGGYGKVGRTAVRLLTGDDTVDQIAVASRDLKRATALASEIGGKAVAVEADGTAEDLLVSQLDGYEIILNAASADVAGPALRAAIRSGTHYCDVVSFEDDIDKAIELSGDAQAAGISAIVANGVAPCITNLMGVHAAQQLDEVEQLQLGDSLMADFATGRELTPRQWREDPRESLGVLPDITGNTQWVWQTMLDSGIRTVRDYRDGRWDDVDPVRSGVDVPLTEGGSTGLCPYVCGAPLFGALPTDIGTMPPAEILFSPFPPRAHELLCELATRVLDGEIDTNAAMDSFLATIEHDPDRWLTLPDDFVPIAKTWCRAVGYKGGRPSRATCWYTAPHWDIGGYHLTSVALVTAMNLIVRGDVTEQGVFAAEKVFKPLSFFAECARLLGDSVPDGKFIEDSVEYLDPA